MEIIFEKFSVLAADHVEVDVSKLISIISGIQKKTLVKLRTNSKTLFKNLSFAPMREV